MTSPRIGLYWFNNDLRTHDQPALTRAALQVDQLICVYYWEPRWQIPNRYGLRDMGEHRQRFLQQSLDDLQDALGKLGQCLLIQTQHAAQGLCELINTYNVSHVFRSRHAGWYENQQWSTVQEHSSEKAIHFEQIDTHTLYDLGDLPFELSDLPASFSKFRQHIEKSKGLITLPPQPPIANIRQLPPPPLNIVSQTALEKPILKADTITDDTRFNGGENTGQQHLQNYFSHSLPAHYKDVRNALDGWDNSCKFSPWLANGSLSAREVYHHLQKYQETKINNESTYWIFFELLWREYFQWYAHAKQRQLFAPKGIKANLPLTSYYPERFKKWCAGNTPYPLVNACMKELAATGYLSNRGRQIVASCLVNELAHDWRYGAAYFEQTLVDYDVASNWGNWQYLAGVGADARGKRHFNLEKQTVLFDPDGHYRAQWLDSQQTIPLDSVDAADWPIY